MIIMSGRSGRLERSGRENLIVDGNGKGLESIVRHQAGISH